MQFDVNVQSRRAVKAASRKGLMMAVATGVLVALGSPGTAWAQSYPDKPITILVGFAPCGLIDVIARLVGQRLQDKLGQPVVVENRSGAAGNIAHRRVATAEPDGYTILGATTSLAINETVYPKRGYVADDFIPISIAALSPELISTHPSGPKTLKEYVDSSRSTSAQFGTAGAGSASYITTQYFLQNLAKVPSTHIPFQGGAPAVAAALGNQVPIVATPPAAGAAAPVRAGKLRGLAIAADKRMALLPDVPTYAEAGYPGFTASAWTGFFLPAKTPKDIALKLNTAISEILKEPATIARLEELGFEPLQLDQKQSEEMYRAEIGKWRTMIEAIGLKVE